MREALLSDTLSPLTYLSEAGSSQQSGRRDFLRTVSFAGIGLAALALSSENILAKPILAQTTEAGLWRDRVTGFIYSVCNGRRAQALTSQLYRANIYYAPRPTDFHSYFSAPYIFVGTTISPEEVICGNGFEVNRFPFYDVQCPCRGINDLNAFEIKRVTNKKEMSYYDCVLAPHSTRMPIEYNDHADIRKTFSNYPYNLADYNIAHKRVYRGHGKSYYGYHITHKTQTGSNGKPMGDVLLSSSDF